MSLFSIPIINSSSMLRANEEDEDSAGRGGYN